MWTNSKGVIWFEMRQAMNYTLSDQDMTLSDQDMVVKKLEKYIDGSYGTYSNGEFTYVDNVMTDHLQNAINLINSQETKIKELNACTQTLIIDAIEEFARKLRREAFFTFNGEGISIHTINNIANAMIQEVGNLKV